MIISIVSTLAQTTSAQNDDIFAQANALEQYYKYGYYALGLFVVLIVGGLIAKATSGRHTSSLDNITGLNVTGLAKEGLLTPEEAAAVRTALSRQIKLRMEHDKRLETMPGGEIALLNDPEVKTLEQKAEVQAREKILSPAKNITQPVPPGNRFPSDFSPEEPNVDLSKPPNSLGESNSDINTVEVPLDILELHSSGVISDEDLENWKRRAKAGKP